MTTNAPKGGRPRLQDLLGAKTPAARAGRAAMQLALLAERKRRLRGLTYKALAERMGGTSPSYVHRMLRGHENSTLKSIYKLADALKMEVRIEFIDLDEAKGQVLDLGDLRQPTTFKRRRVS